MTEVVVFDLDGVLWNSGEAHRTAFIGALAGIPGFDVETFEYAKVAGMRTDEAMRTLLSAAGISPSDDNIARLVARKRALARARLERTPPIVPDCEATLKLLKSRFRLAIASSSSRENVDLFLGKASVDKLFDVVVSGECVSQAKPHPAIYQEALRRLKLEPASAIAVEDSIAGIESAMRAGLKVAAISGTETETTLAHSGAKWIIGSFSDLARLQ